MTLQIKKLSKIADRFKHGQRTGRYGYEIVAADGVVVEAGKAAHVMPHGAQVEGRKRLEAIRA